MSPQPIRTIGVGRYYYCGNIPSLATVIPAQARKAGAGYVEVRYGGAQSS
jgi:hypothetical protein